MPFIYKISVLDALKEKGYSSYRLRKEKIFSEKTIQSFRNMQVVNLANLSTLCDLLQCDIGDIIRHLPSQPRYSYTNNPLIAKLKAAAIATTTTTSPNSDLNAKDA